MPQTLADVLHYFIPEVGPGPASAPARPQEGALPATPPRLPFGLAKAPRPDASPVPAVPLLAVPLGPRDVVRAAFVWNLGVELARLGASSTILAPSADEGSALWPEAGRGPLGSELVLTRAESLEAVAGSARSLAAAREREAPHAPSLVLAAVPPAWLARGCDDAALLQRVLLFCSPDRRDLLETYAVVKRVLATSPTAQIGVTIHGVRSVAEARDAFLRLAGATERHLLRSLVSYGLIVDDLAVYRSILAQRAVSLAHPQSAAARALGEVARLLLRDLDGDPRA
ncbi:MAG TPA: hypothetical protein VMW35_20220 [Myxococcota bacterium]|jgi:hypothetical protein|nr:hypothetical protein [Myxococcota bacterium]